MNRTAFKEADRAFLAARRRFFLQNLLPPGALFMLAFLGVAGESGDFGFFPPRHPIRAYAFVAMLVASGVWGLVEIIRLGRSEKSNQEALGLICKACGIGLAMDVGIVIASGNCPGCGARVITEAVDSGNGREA